MKKKLLKITTIAFLFITPILTAPKLPKIPTIKVTLPVGVQQYIRDYVGNLNLKF